MATAVHVGPAFTRGAKENGWESANALDFKLRGHNYLKDKVKIKSAPSAFRLVGVRAYPDKHHEIYGLLRTALLVTSGA